MSDDDGQAPGPPRTPEPPRTPRRPHPRDRARDEVLAALDARVQRMNEVVTESADLLSQAIPRIDTLMERVGELGGRLDEVAGVEQPTPPPNPPVHWPALSAEQARTEWERLAAWVEGVLGPWYGVTRGELPDCWAWHRRAVVVLSGLRTAYVAAYRPDGRPEAVPEWHTRWLPAGLIQIGEAIDEHWCRPGLHLQHDKHSNRKTPRRRALPHELDRNHHPSSPADDVALADDPIHPSFWRPYYEEAVSADLTGRWRAERDEAARRAGPAT